MLLKVDFSKPHFQLLYYTLYQRILKFALETGDSEEMVKPFFVSLVAQDNRASLFINLDDNANVIAHCLLHVQPITDSSFDLFCDQVVVDSGHDEEWIKELLSHLKSLSGLRKILAVAEEKRAKSWAKKYGFTLDKVIISSPKEV